jgi:hypothetical protein
MPKLFDRLDSKNFVIVYDADCLVNLRDEYDIQDRDKLSNIIDKLFLPRVAKR